MSWSEESKNKFRVKVKVILEKLVRRLGFDSVAPLVPYATLMTNIRKAIARKDRQRKDGGRKGDRNGSDSDEDESDSDDMEDVAPVRGKARRAQGGGAYVVEGKSDRDILDFLAPSASKHVRSVGPEQRGTKRGREDKFERNEEGRMIIEDLPEKVSPCGRSFPYATRTTCRRRRGHAASSKTRTVLCPTRCLAKILSRRTPTR